MAPAEPTVLAFQTHKDARYSNNMLFMFKEYKYKSQIAIEQVPLNYLVKNCSVTQLQVLFVSHARKKDILYNVSTDMDDIALHLENTFLYYSN